MIPAESLNIPAQAKAGTAVAPATAADMMVHTAGAESSGEQGAEWAQADVGNRPSTFWAAGGGVGGCTSAGEGSAADAHGESRPSAALAAGRKIGGWVDSAGRRLCDHAAGGGGYREGNGLDGFDWTRAQRPAFGQEASALPMRLIRSAATGRSSLNSQQHPAQPGPSFWLNGAAVSAEGLRQGVAARQPRPCSGALDSWPPPASAADAGRDGAGDGFGGPQRMHDQPPTLAGATSAAASAPDGATAGGGAEEAVRYSV
jgi:hypothetical protein